LGVVAVALLAGLTVWAVGSLPIGNPGGDLSISGNLTNDSCIELNVEGTGAISSINRIKVGGQSLKSPQDYQVHNIGSSQVSITFTDPQTGPIEISGNTSNSGSHSGSISSCS